MSESLQKEYVREVVGVKPNVRSMCNWILANQDKIPATADNIKRVYPEMNKERKKGVCIVLKYTPPALK
jgi:hypothetical protein